MRLHVFPQSNNAVAVLATAYHCELPVELVFVDLLKGAQKTRAFTALNPYQRMPVLEDDDFVLWESNAIAQYLAAQCPASGLWPWEPRRQADVARWQFWQAAHWGPTCAVFTFERVVKRFAGLGPADEAAVTRAAPDFHSCAGVLNASSRYPGHRRHAHSPTSPRGVARVRGASRPSARRPSCDHGLVCRFDAAGVAQALPAA
jgi:glutathione S-transferase